MVPTLNDGEGYLLNRFACLLRAPHRDEVVVIQDPGHTDLAVKRVVAVHDIGRVINRQTADSQVIGAITQGLSAGLFEEKIMDAATGPWSTTICTITRSPRPGTSR